MPALFLFCFFWGFLQAQNRPEVEVRFVPDSIMIGDRFTLQVDITKDMVQVTDFPVFEGGQFNRYIEIVGEGGLDTVERNGRTVKLRKEYTLTTFEDGIHMAGRFPILYMDKNITDTLYSRDSLLLLVTTFDIDTLTQTIYDIKPPMKAPLLLGEIIGYLLGGYILLLVLILVVLLIINNAKNRPPAEKRRGEPAHITAIKQLEKLHAQKLWQGGKHKQYYTGLTDILREYIEKLYGIKAMEMTSAEIREGLSPMIADGKTLAELSEVLVTADFVKFAKYTPDGELNDALYYKAYYFVENTKEEVRTEVVVEEIVVEPLTEEKAPDSGAGQAGGENKEEGQ